MSPSPLPPLDSSRILYKVLLGCPSWRITSTAERLGAGLPGLESGLASSCGTLGVSLRPPPAPPARLSHPDSGDTGTLSARAAITQDHRDRA